MLLSQAGTSHHLSPVSCLLSPVSCLLSPVSLQRSYWCSAKQNSGPAPSVPSPPVSARAEQCVRGVERA